MRSYSFLRKIAREETEVYDVSLNYLRSIRPSRMKYQDVFDNEDQACFIELSTEVHFRSPKGDDNDCYEELKKGFKVLCIVK